MNSAEPRRLSVMGDVRRGAVAIGRDRIGWEGWEGECLAAHGSEPQVFLEMEAPLAMGLAHLCVSRLP